jgi:hypothetical protein
MDQTNVRPFLHLQDNLRILMPIRSNQIFTPHISMADFVLWPAFRDLVVQFPQLQERMAWLADMSTFIKCEWPYELEHALHRDPVSGNVDLSDLAKVLNSCILLIRLC